MGELKNLVEYILLDKIGDFKVGMEKPNTTNATI